VFGGVGWRSKVTHLWWWRLTIDGL